MYGGQIMEVVDAINLHKSNHPYTKGLLACLPKINGARDRLPTLVRDDAWLKPVQGSFTGGAVS
jgi:peptide/nickel transport system ATP-binding protein